MVSYHKPEHINFLFNTDEFNSSLSTTLTLQDANDIFLSKTGSDTVSAYINWIETQIYHSNLDFKDDDNITQLQINKDGINSMSLDDIENCSFTGGNIQLQINNINEIHTDHLDLININIDSINLMNNTTIPNVDSKTITNLNSINAINNTTIPNVDSKTITNLNSINLMNNTTIPNVDSKTVTNLNSINAINNTTIPNVDSKTVTNLDSINLMNNTTIPNLITNYKNYTDNALASLVDSSPQSLDTLNELANSLGNDTNFATTVSNSIGLRATTIYVNNQNVNLQNQINTINNTTIPNVDSKTITNLNSIDTINNTTIPNVDSKTVTNLNAINLINNTTIPNVNSKTITNLNSIDTINNTTIPNVDSKTVTNLNAINSINNTTIPNIDSKTVTNLNSIDTINNTTIPNVDSKTVTNLNAINLINNTTIPNVDSKTVTNLNSIDTINNTTIPNVDSKTVTNLNAINSINNTTIPNIDSKTVTNLNSIDTINNTTIPNVDSKTITNLNSINAINNTTIPNVDSKTITNLDSINLMNNTTIPNVDSKTVTNLNSINTINNTTIPNIENNINNLQFKTQQIEYDYNYEKLILNSDVEFIESAKFQNDVRINDIGNQQISFQHTVNNGYIGGEITTSNDNLYISSYENKNMGNFIYQIQPRKLILNGQYGGDVDISDVNSTVNIPGSINNPQIDVLKNKTKEIEYVNNKTKFNGDIKVTDSIEFLNDINDITSQNFSKLIHIDNINTDLREEIDNIDNRIIVNENKFNVLENGDSEINNIKTNNIYTHSFLKSYNIITDGIESVYHQWNEIGDFTIESNINGNIDIQYSFGLRNISPTITINEILIGIVTVRIYGPAGNILITDTTQYDGSENNILPGFTTVEPNGFALSLNDYSTGNYKIKAQFTSPQLYNNGSETSDIKIIWNYFNTSSIVITKNVHDDIVKSDDEYLYTGHINAVDIETKKITIENIYVPMIRAYCYFNYYSGLTMHKSYNLIVTNFPSSEGHFYVDFDVNFPPDIYYTIQCEGSHSANDGYAQCLYFTKFNKTVSQFELKQYTHFNSTVNHSNSDGWTSISVIW